jgi:hypothetical protein
MIWAAIIITVISSTSCSVGKALQKEATRHLPRFSAGDRKILAQYLQSRLWLTGLAADLGGAVMQIAAFAMAPVSLSFLPHELGGQGRVGQSGGSPPQAAAAHACGAATPSTAAALPLLILPASAACLLCSLCLLPACRCLSCSQSVAWAWLALQCIATSS